MTLQLDPRHQLVWRSPTSLQLGADRPVVAFADITAAQERMLSALVVGVTDTGLDLIAQSVDADPSDAQRLLRAVRPALRPAATEHPTPAPVVCLNGSGATARSLTRALAEAGVDVRAVTDSQPDEVDAELELAEPTLAVIVAHFVVDPGIRGHWLRRDIPHLPVVIGDALVRVGPFIEPGTGPCLWCLDRERTDRDAAWPAMASQLLGRRSHADGGIAAMHAAAIAARTVLHRLGGPSSRATSVTIDLASGVTTTETWSRHPECGCAALPESATAGVVPNGPRRSRPTTPRAIASRA